MELRHRWVSFRVSDVYIPPPETLLLELHGHDLLEGRVIDLSDSGIEKDTFAIVEVDELKRPVIVPVARILGVS
jgi:hypothetical protein